MAGKRAQYRQVPDSAGQVPDNASGLTVAEVSAELGISERTVRRYLSAETLTKVPGSKPVQATRESVERCRAEQSQNRQVPDSAGQVPDDAGQGASGDNESTLVEILRQQVADLQRRLDESEAERRRITEQKDHALWAAVEATRMIEAPDLAESEPEDLQESAPATPKRRFWRWGRKN